MVQGASFELRGDEPRIFPDVFAQRDLLKIYSNIL
jgi:hypothetical protein